MPGQLLRDHIREAESRGEACPHLRDVENSYTNAYLLSDHVSAVELPVALQILETLQVPVSTEYFRASREYLGMMRVTRDGLTDPTLPITY
jgi:hypothetical protein